ncbi:unnamed protein product [Ectocarpus sp. 4 AP-2014]
MSMLFKNGGVNNGQKFVALLVPTTASSQISHCCEDIIFTYVSTGTPRKQRLAEFVIVFRIGHTKRATCPLVALPPKRFMICNTAEYFLPNTLVLGVRRDRFRNFQAASQYFVVRQARQIVVRFLPAIPKQQRTRPRTVPLDTILNVHLYTLMVHFTKEHLGEILIVIFRDTSNVAHGKEFA